MSTDKAAILLERGIFYVAKVHILDHSAHPSHRRDVYEAGGEKAAVLGGGGPEAAGGSLRSPGGSKAIKERAIFWITRIFVLCFVFVDFDHAEGGRCVYLGVGEGNYVGLGTLFEKVCGCFF